MWKRELGFRKIPHSILLLFSIFVLVGSVGSANGVVLKTYSPSNYNILNGTYLAGSVLASLQTVDSDYFIVGSSPSATSASMYNPSAYNFFGSTAYVSGITGDLVSDNGIYMVFASYASATSPQTLYAHQETTAIAGIPYYFLQSESAEASGMSLSASMASTGRQLWGKIVYPLTGVSSIPATTWTVYYRAWHSSVPSNISTNSPSSTVSVVAGWDNTTNAYADDAAYAISDTSTAAQKYGGYGFNLPSGATINQVRVRLDAWCKEDDDIQLEVSTDGGSTFLPTSSTIDLAASETTYWVDVTSWTTWTVDKINNDKIWTKVTHKKDATTDEVSLDWIPVEVTYTTPPSVHADVDILIRKSDGTIRQTIATNAANSGTLTTTAQTLSATYSWSAYTVVDQTDYLEIDYYVDVTAAKSGVIAYLRIDDNTLSVADQTRVSNVYLPSEYTMEIEFTGSSNMYNWTQLVWSIDSSWTTGNASVTLQLYNYTLGVYPTSGNGFISYTSSATPNTDETKTQTITTNPQHFRDVAGNWKIKVKGIKTTTTPFNFKADWVEFRPTYYSEYTVSTEFLFLSMTTNTPTQLNFTVVSQYNTANVGVTIQVWNYSSSTYATSDEAYLKYTFSATNETKTLSINTNRQFYTSNGDAKIKITGFLSTPNQFQQEINQVIIKVSTQISSQPFGWFTALLYVLPLVFVLLFLLALKLRRKKTTVSPKHIQPPEGSLGEPKPKKPHIAKKTDAFSQQFGMTHQQMIGKKMLLEIDPTSDYHKALSSFVSEAKNSDEMLFILTNRNSTLHSTFSGAANVKFLLLTSKTSSPQQINEKETLLPASDLSVLLDVFVRIQKVETKETINVLFDSLSDIILRCGFEKTYKFTRFLLEAISSPKTTVLFLFNPTAHDQVISSSIRGLFHIKLAYAKSGPKVGTL